jgi:hypothetical protein
MSRADRIAILLSLIAVLVCYWIGVGVFESMAHLEDEYAYLWQAQAITRGQLTLPTPPDQHSFLIPFVVDYNGHRFGKYPPGWPVVLAFGEAFGLRSLVNALLAGFGIWLTYRLGKKTFGETVGLLAAGLTLVSPFFLMNSGSLLSHPLGLVLSAAFAMAWLDAFWNPAFPRPWLPALTAAFCLGVLALTRPMSAVAVALPFALHGLVLFIKGSRSDRLRLLGFGVVTAAIAGLYFAWQWAVTGDPLLNPYTLWWPYDTIGFGPGVGVTARGHNLDIAWTNTSFSLWVGWHDLFGWAGYSWIFLPFGLAASLYHRDRGQRLNTKALLPGSVFPSLVVVYLAYWIGSFLFGPRYFYEGLSSLTLFSAAGIAFLAGWPTRPGEPWRRYTGLSRFRPLAATAVLVLLVSANLIFYTPMRVGGMYGLYGVKRANLEPFLSEDAQKLAPAVIVVHPGSTWIGYGRLLDLQNAFLDTPFLFVIARGRRADAALQTYFPERNVYHYYPDEPYVFYTSPRPGSYD